MKIKQLVAELEHAAKAKDAKQYQKALKCYHLLLRETENHTEPELIGIRLRALAGQGDLLQRTGQQQKALETYQQWLSEVEPDQIGHVDALVQLGQQQIRMGDNEKALETLRLGQELAENFNYTEGKAQIFSALAWVHEQLSQPQKALYHYQIAHALFVQIENRYESAYTLKGIGKIEQSLGLFDKAINSLQKCVFLCRQIGDQLLLCQSLADLGECYLYMYNGKKALICHQEGLEIAKLLQFKTNLAQLNYHMGLNLYHLFRPVEAIPYLETSLEIAVKANLPDIQLNTLYSLGRVHLQEGNIFLARNLAINLQMLAGETANKNQQIHALFLLGLCHKADNQPYAAQALWQQAVFMAEEAEQRYSLWQLHIALSEIAPNPDIAAVYRNMARSVIDNIIQSVTDQSIIQTFKEHPTIQQILSY